MFDTVKSEQVLDLHGQPKSSVEAVMTAFVEKAIQDQQETVTIITGLGNHPNSVGKHSVLFKELVKLLNVAPFRPRIKYLIRNIGFYRIIFDVPVTATNPMVSHQDTPPFCKEEAMIKGFVFDPSKNPLFEVIKNSDPARRQFELEALLTKNPHLLRASDQGGTTALMVAAACNQVDTMAWLVLEDRKLINTPRPLKQQKYDGTTTLMIAVLHNSQEAIDYLLKQAPSLLKKRRFDGASVFSVAAYVKPSEKLLELLYKHLEPHKRERGYTGLFREYKGLKKEMAQIQPSSSVSALIPIIESEKFKRYQLTYRWFFMDRMMLFLKKMDQTRPSFHLLSRSLQRALNQEGCTAAQVREIWRIFSRNKKLKTAFLRFNNAYKGVFEFSRKKNKIKTKARRIQTVPGSFRRTLLLDFFYIRQKNRISLSQAKPILRQIIEKARSNPIKNPIVQHVRPLVFSYQKSSFGPSRGPTLRYPSQISCAPILSFSSNEFHDTSRRIDGRSDGHHEVDYSSARKPKARAAQTPPVSIGRGRELSTQEKPWHPENGRCFGNYKCKCGACWNSVYSWADETQACKDCGADVLAYKQRPLKKSNAEKPTVPHRQDLCGKCQGLGRLCSLSMEKSTSNRYYDDVVVKGLPLDTTEQRLKEILRAYGSILRVYIPPANLEFSSRLAFITFQNPESALQKFNEVDVKTTYRYR